MKKEITLETEMMCIYSGPTHIEISNSRCKELNKKYSVWYPISSSTIKGFNDRWGYERI